MVNIFTPTTNIANKVRNTKLPRTKPLMPLFELISNSIHSIEDAINDGLIQKDNGLISVECIRNGNQETLEVLPNIDHYPIHSFIVKDNGIGLNEENLKAFTEADTDRKIEIGGKGVGRFVCLKAFKELNIKSCFFNGDQKQSIAFNFKSTKEGFHDFANIEESQPTTGTSIRLNFIREEYQKNLPKELISIAREIVAHFQLYFIRTLSQKVCKSHLGILDF